MQASDPGIFFLAACHNMLTLSSTSPIGQIGADICKILPFAQLQLMTERARPAPRPKPCRPRTRSRARSGAGSVTTVNGAGDGGRKASPILLYSHPNESLSTRPTHS